MPVATAFSAQAEHQLAFAAFTQKQYEQLSPEEYEVAILAAYTAPAATVEEFKAHINTGRPLPGGPGLLFKGQRDAPQAKLAFDFKGATEKKPWQADKAPVSDETGARKRVPPYKCKGCGKYAHHFATGNFEDLTVATKCNQGDCRHPRHDGTAMMAKTAKATVSQPILSQSVEASIAKALALIHEAIKRNQRHEEAAYAGIEEFEGNEFGLGQHKAYGAMHIGEIADEQKLADGNAQEMSENAEKQVHLGQRRSSANAWANVSINWFGIIFGIFTVYTGIMSLCSSIWGPEYATECVMDSVNGI